LVRDNPTARQRHARRDPHMTLISLYFVAAARDHGKRPEPKASEAAQVAAAATAGSMA
jgi:hypothetical protein